MAVQRRTIVHREKTPAQQEQRSSRVSSRLDEASEDVIISPLSKSEMKTLQSRGVFYPDLPARNKLSVSDLLTKIEQKSPNSPDKIISPAKQLKALNTIMSNPLRGSYVLAISSYPSDLRAKYLAATIMNEAIKVQQKVRSFKALPLWHHVYGGAGDVLRDKPLAESPTMLVISNVNANSSQTKLEKVRDLLEKFSNIPRIVVLGGSDPCSLFSNYLHFPLKVGLYLGPGRKTYQI